jgi:periplasmic divalent cation tolerance protein
MAASSTYLIVLCTCPDRETAESLANEALAQRLAACVNIIDRVTSVFEWQSAIEREQEVLLLAKTSREAYDALEILWKSRHPYELPEVIAVPIETGSESYLQWIDQAVSR